MVFCIAAEAKQKNVGNDTENSDDGGRFDGPHLHPEISVTSRAKVKQVGLVIIEAALTVDHIMPSGNTVEEATGNREGDCWTVVVFNGEPDVA
ncbi:hypothetical protein HPP92_004721 [Vanilla planifolia]|uniref:Uncharacterized protein n=1 Tax=Vanilla planifolia TaxID=51239 RepID=A0A835RY15_VANPL|nr:hypothetical protein HPP92_005079 [Vanilla planifolia]KAG0493727.1 hypothetical protein HPP92_004721 [Vanilla planifolia]